MTHLLLALAVMTMRVDYYHTGNVTQEHFSLDRVVVEPLPWPGNPAKPIDTTNRGKYLATVRDAATGAVIYSRGFSSVFGEWETTAEARTLNRTFSESVRFPAPGQPVRVTLAKRDAENLFQEIWTVAIDPADKFIARERPSPAAGPLIKFREAGHPADKLDLLILGDGYTAAERTKFEDDAKRLLDVLFSISPFKERAGDINVWGLCPPALESGISYPSRREYRHSPVGTSFDAFGTERYVLTFENKALRDMAANSPYEVVEILANSARYGGGGIFGNYGTVAAGSGLAPYIFVHEFGHHLAGLTDEYYTSPVAYLPAVARVEPWEPNATVLLDPTALKWKDLVAPGTPLPTPWPKEEFERLDKERQERPRVLRREGRPESEVEAIGLDYDEQVTKLLTSGPNAGKVGAFEGANYEARGSYRPEEICIMFHRGWMAFCLVCRRAIEATLDLYSGS